MAEKISAKLTQVDAEIQKIKTSAKEAAKATKDIQSGLRIDGTNLRLIADKFAAMRVELQQNTELIKKYKAAISELETKRGALSQTDPNYQTNYAHYTTEINRYLAALRKVEIQTESLANATKKSAENQALAAAAVAKTEKSFATLEKTSRKLSIAMIAVVGVLAKIATSAISTGTELYKLSQRYNTNVEDIQKWNRALQLATGENELFTNSLSSMQKGFSQIATGSGTQYARALQQIGLSYRELTAMDNNAKFETITNALADIDDINERTAAAQTLLGDSGAYIAKALENGTVALDGYLQSASAFGTVTQTDAERLNALNTEFEIAKSQISAAGAEIAVSLTPVLLTLAGILNDTVVPILKGVADFLNGIGSTGQKVLLFLAAALILLPKLVSMIKAVKTAIDLATASTTLLNVATASWKVILLAVAAVVMTIVSLIAIFSNSAKSALNDVKNLTNAANDLSAAGGEFVAHTVQNVNTTTVKKLVVDVNSKSSGNTPIERENAQTIAQLTVEEINRRLGDLIKLPKRILNYE